MDLDLLRQKVDQFVLHFDVCGTSAQCFYVLHDRRGLSVHFMLDVDGTIYQTLDVKERAWQATKSNDQKYRNRDRETWARIRSGMERKCFGNGTEKRKRERPI